MTLSPSLCDAVRQSMSGRFPADIGVFTPLWVRDLPLGFVNTFFAARLRTDSDSDISSNDGVLRLNAENWRAAGEILQNIARSWHDAGFYDGWRDEKFDVRSSEGEVLFALERSAFRPLGFLSHAVHLNAYVRDDDGNFRFWVGRRSPNKAVDPDKLDNLTGGGVSTGESVEQAMRREAYEEAGVPGELLHGLRERSRLLSLRRVRRGLHREWLHVFDFPAPRDFIPENRDGEVVSFTLMRPEEIAEAVIDGQFMNDAARAMLDSFVRLDIWNGEVPEFSPSCGGID